MSKALIALGANSQLGAFRPWADVLVASSESLFLDNLHLALMKTFHKDVGVRLEKMMAGEAADISTPNALRLMALFFEYKAIALEQLGSPSSIGALKAPLKRVFAALELHKSTHVISSGQAASSHAPVGAGAEAGGLTEDTTSHRDIGGV